MTAHRTYPNNSQGFTLIEIAVVMVIIGLLLGGLLAPLSMQMENDRRKETQATLVSIREALIGFALINKYLPCPDANNNGLADDLGCSSSNAIANVGRLPFATLAVSSTDSWGNPWTYAVNGAYTTDVALTKTTAGSGAGLIEVRSGTGCTGTRLANNVPALVWSGGKSNLAGVSTLEAENANGDRCFTDAAYVTGNAGFDDMLTWIAPAVLINRLVAAGSL